MIHAETLFTIHQDVQDYNTSEIFCDRRLELLVQTGGYQIGKLSNKTTYTI